MSEQLMINALRKLRESTAKSKTARLRDLYDEVEALRSSGFSHAKIVETMWDQGLKFDLKTFEVTFYRIKKERSIASVTTRTSKALAPTEMITNGHKTMDAPLSMPEAFFKTASTTARAAGNNEDARSKLRKLGGSNPTEYNPIPDRTPEF